MPEIAPLKLEVKNNIAVIRFVRPEMKNPLSVEILEDLKVAFDQLNLNIKIDSIIFSGSDNVFAAGANLKEVSALNSEAAVDFGLRGQNLMQKIMRSDKRTVAAVNGFCMGGALDLALSCDERIASPNAVFAHPGAKLGIITGWGGTQMLPRLIGTKRANEIFASAREIRADEALQIGLVDEISENPLAKSIQMHAE